MLSPMRYKSFTWPHNPRTYAIRYIRQTAVHKVPLGLYTMQDLGRTCRVLSGEGEFYGKDAYDTFKALATVFYEPGPGTLIHPIWQTSSAYFTALQLRQEPREDYVAYSFEFQEGYSGYGSVKTCAAPQRTAAAPRTASASYVTICAGDTLWAVAQRAGLRLQELLALNPTIANPNLIVPGQKVRVA